MRNPYHHHHHHNHHHREKKRSVAGASASDSGSFHGSSECSYIPPFFAARSASDHRCDGLLLNDPPLMPSQAQPTWCQSYLNQPRLLRLGSSSNSAEDQPSTAVAWTYSSAASAWPQDPINAQYIIGGERIVGGGSVFGGHGDAESDPSREPDGLGTTRPRARARRGQATDPHSIAERLRRERIAERMKALQEMVPSANKSDKASVLDEIIEYVKFLQLQVKVLSLSRAADGHVRISQSMAADRGQCEGDGGVAVAEGHVARLIEEEDMGSAMAFLQAKGLCLMPIALANAISSKPSRPNLDFNGLYHDMVRGHFRRDIPGGHCHEAQGFSVAFDQSGLNGASSSSSCIGTADGDSAIDLGQAQQQHQQQWP